ncbi:MAG: pantoate--beta-alanine ligase [Methylococcales bacterium]|nr:pantoate--beta-alanine ligase [Methylococcales bacterium]MCK5924689.1 pantoate--beta-alanine ligase [Methylococcales bacterium]
MKTTKSIQIVRATVAQWKSQRLTIAFVPTMGNLHQGHLALVKAAQKKADKVIVSIFVNPSQFSAGEDFSTYPRTEQADIEALATHHVDMLFLPPVDEIYHSQAKTHVIVSELSDLHCGAHRQGHFSGVSTIVCKLINMTQAHYLFLGEKDFQQLAIIRLMIRDLNLPIQLKSVPIVRENDGLAMSSRNGYLTSEQRQIAPKLYQALCNAKKALQQSTAPFKTIEQQQKDYLTQNGFNIDYFSICRADNLLPATSQDTELVILAAASLGKPRLIDNLCLTLR